MKILLTRPEGRNQLMIEALNLKSVSHIVTPLLHVTPAPATHQNQYIDQINHADIIIFISTNAVKFAANAIDASHPHIAWPAKAEYYAVGEATFNALTHLGITAQEAPQNCQQTEGLLTLPQLQNLSGKKIVIVRGVGGREVLATTLASRGGQVSYWEVYRRGCPELPKDSTAIAWQQAEIDTIIVTSGEILDNLIKLVPKELFAWLRACHIIVPSSRVQEQAFAYGLQHVTNAKAANCKAILSALGL
ncbi:uroporphyrinogen-III synthase [Shewanella eurypsychrophilus]|uniref:Uroporphyrinogen-III synthase n=1 Tax=Shewanella eurypsychrophilus TaxID=2593656 RepID=A0ABX6V1E7_9GAMM|nr:MULTISPECIES: uroporphyrinogen-III synthase [Shewanella]QFU21122.1 uroporphyrinogen-III synthase [Shewanella sp. YLB-09]QPG56413.1 uroporphyrinogen-III synthase [Shewanella eurypsychrophilus]